MLRVLEAILRRAGGQARRRRPRRCIPSLSESSSCLEDRMLLSAAGGSAPAAEVGRDLAETRAGKEVTGLFQSILRTDPTGAQLTRFVRELRGGIGVRALRKELIAGAAMPGATPAPGSPMVVVVGGRASAPAMAATGAAAAGTIPAASMMPGLAGASRTNTSPIHVSQMPAGVRISRGSAPASSRTGTLTPASGGTSSSSSMSAPMGSTSTMTGMGSTMSPTGSMGSAAASAGAGTSGGTISPLPVSPLPVTPLPIAPLPVSPLPIAPMPIANM
jgi:hypothetical protein